MAEKSSGSWWKWILTVVVLAATTGGYLYYSHGHTPPVTYNTAPVTRGELTKVVTATGSLAPVVSVTVGSQVSGLII